VVKLRNSVAELPFEEVIGKNVDIRNVKSLAQFM
jgi:hypothetical protein